MKITMMIAVVTMMIVSLFVAMAAGEVYRVGDSDGWTNVGNVDYKNWSATKRFQVGDTIFFRYNREFHNVVRVTHENFLTCNGTAPYATMHSGKDSFPIKKPGHYYFICSSPDHCQSGQKVDIHVPPPVAAPIQPLPFPYPPPSVPSPAPEKSTAPVANDSPATVVTAPANAPAPPKSDGSQLINGMKIWLMFIAVYFYLI